MTLTPKSDRVYLGKFKANLTYEHRYENSKYNITKQNLILYKKNSAYDQVIINPRNAMFA